jgi:hypothetical protein
MTKTYGCQVRNCFHGMKPKDLKVYDLKLWGYKMARPTYVTDWKPS